MSFFAECGYSLTFSVILFIGRRAIIMLLPLTTSIPAAFISTSYVIDVAPDSVPRRLSNLLVDTNAPKR